MRHWGMDAGSRRDVPQCVSCPPNARPRATPPPPQLRDGPPAKMRLHHLPLRPHCRRRHHTHRQLQPPATIKPAQAAALPSSPTVWWKPLLVRTSVSTAPPPSAPNPPKQSPGRPAVRPGGRHHCADAHSLPPRCSLRRALLLSAISQEIPLQVNASPAVGALAGLSFAWELDQEHSHQANSTDGQILPAKAAKSGESEPAKEVLQTHGV